MMHPLIVSAFFVLLFPCCSEQLAPTQHSQDERPIAFPGAEGFGKYATGGRGGKVFVVTNLNDDGDGSFRKAVTAKEPRIVVFAVSGTIRLLSPLPIRGNVTIAGQSAPGDGICIADHPVVLSGNNIIIRYVRFRMGDRYQNKGHVPGSGSDDALAATRRTNIIIDHCSLGWSTDEVLSVYAGDSTTLQWNLIAEPLNYSYHFEKGDTDYERHGYGGIWGGAHLTAHHNLFAHCSNRNPRFDGTRNAPEENVDYRNNVIYNWGSNTIYAGEGGNYNIINNYFRYGPSTNVSVRYRIVNPGRTEEISFGKWYVNGNYVEDAKDITQNNWLGIHMGNNGTTEDKKNTVVTQPHPALPIGMESAQDAYASVLHNVGASLHRDTLDERIIRDVRNRTGRLIDVQGGFEHGTAFEKTLNAWPTLQSTAPPLDTDNDGMPDEWEKKQGLDPANLNDASQYRVDRNYTNLEVYLNSLVK